ncbi:GntR family transcriptional regulator [Burkholderia cepacia]|uniref:GntR family transcriptional regulator n=1 Tax=Burkholderia cepacia TaxID=292 RepID=UPI001296F88A|nr:GntR family transcriptional regulator [Burkholderia cepacia]QFS37612.1 Bacterial regulatory protein, gntR family [Burkholderia cepacia]
MTQTHDVEARLREMILDMELGPGERLTERGIEAQLGASRTPVRAALQKLEAEGLICRDGRGWMVSPLDIREIEQLFVYREVLEVAAIQLAVQHTNQEKLAALEALVGSGTGRVTKREAHRLGTEFHLQLVGLAGNDFISRGVQDAMTRLSRARWLDPASGQQGNDEHRAILVALRKGDEKTAAELVRKHIHRSRERLIKLLGESRQTLRAHGIRVA